MSATTSGRNFTSFEGKVNSAACKPAACKPFGGHLIFSGSSTLLGGLLALGLAPGVASAATIPLTGTLNTPEDLLETPLVLVNAGTVTLQTWGFGGGTNGAGHVIPSGGFDPFVAIFSGTDGSASIVNTNGGAITYGTSDDLSNYGAFIGCPPAGAVPIGRSPACGDITMSLALGAGNYIIVLTDGANIANAVFDNGTLDEGFTDLTGVVFQTCDISNNCINGSGNWALDITTPDVSAAAPEPDSILLAGIGLLLVSLPRLWSRKQRVAGRHHRAPGQFALKEVLSFAKKEIYR